MLTFAATVSDSDASLLAIAAFAHRHPPALLARPPLSSQHWFCMIFTSMLRRLRAAMKLSARASGE